MEENYKSNARGAPTSNMATASIVPNVPNNMNKLKSDPTEKKSPSRERNKEDQEVIIPTKSLKETSARDDESLVSQSISNYSRMTPMAQEMQFANEECTFGRGTNLAQRIEHTFGRRTELQ